MSEEIRDVVKTIIETQIVSALNEAPEAIEKLVRAALSEKVDASGNPGGYRADKPYLDWLIGQEIRGAAQVALQRVLREDMRPQIEEQVRAALKSTNVTEAIANAVIGAADREWSINIKFETDKDR